VEGVGTPYEAGWWGFGLGDHRPCDGTYALTDAALLPPAPPAEALRRMDWLPVCEGEDAAEELAALVAQADALGVVLPETLLRLFARPRYYQAISSCTDCYLELGERIVPDPTGRGWLLRFYADSQWCVLWYLYLDPTQGTAAVVASYEHIDEAWHRRREDGGEDAAGLMVAVAASVEEFVWRVWIENALWFGEHGSPERLTPEAAAYGVALDQLGGRS
jgi:hypothetical protein